MSLACFQSLNACLTSWAPGSGDTYKAGQQGNRQWVSPMSTNSWRVIPSVKHDRRKYTDRCQGRRRNAPAAWRSPPPQPCAQERPHDEACLYYSITTESYPPASQSRRKSDSEITFRVTPLKHIQANRRHHTLMWDGAGTMLAISFNKNKQVN